MTFALFGRAVTDQMLPFLQEFILRLEQIDGATWIFQPFFSHIEGRVRFSKKPHFFRERSDIEGKVDFICTIGGDGTILDAVGLNGDSGIPIIGINMGKLGFLSSISKEGINPALDMILKGSYTIENRTMLMLHNGESLFPGFPFALNDLAIYKSDLQTMLTIRAYINDEFLNSYWADGLILATPTGSTAYSLSCTGPIVVPGSENFLITPIASHNLTVRPVVIRDDARIRINVEGDGEEYFIAMDSRKTKVTGNRELIVTKAGFPVRLVRLPGQHFFKTIREKLNWGLDARN